jgi:hypothetical protein
MYKKRSRYQDTANKIIEDKLELLHWNFISLQIKLIRDECGENCHLHADEFVMGNKLVGKYCNVSMKKYNSNLSSNSIYIYNWNNVSPP